MPVNQWLENYRGSMGFKKKLIFLGVFSLSCAVSSNEVAINAMPNEGLSSSKILLRQSHFNFSDGISEAEALYSSQNYCIQTNRNQYLNISNPHIKDDGDVWTIIYEVLPKILDEMEKNPSEELFYKILPFIMMINKETGKALLVKYKLNPRTKKIHVSDEELLLNP